MERLLGLTGWWSQGSSVSVAVTVVGRASLDAWLGGGRSLWICLWLAVGRVAEVCMGSQSGHPEPQVFMCGLQEASAHGAR